MATLNRAHARYISRVYVYVHTCASMHLQHIQRSLHARSRTYINVDTSHVCERIYLGDAPRIYVYTRVLPGTRGQSVARARASSAKTADDTRRRDAQIAVILKSIRSRSRIF